MLGKSLLALAAVAPTYAFAGGFTYKEWVQSSEEWRRGFAFGVAEQLTVVVIPAEAPDYRTTYAYKVCLTGVPAPKIEQIVDGYVARHPESHALPMVGVAMQALHEVCLPLFPDPVSTRAMTGDEALTLLNHDHDQTLEIAEVIDASTKLFFSLNSDGDTTLERKEVAGRLTEADWKAFNSDGDETLEMDEWLMIVRKRFIAADVNKDGKLTVRELDSPAGQDLIKVMVK